jgi:hypothetical protein
MDGRLTGPFMSACQLLVKRGAIGLCLDTEMEESHQEQRQLLPNLKEGFQCSAPFLCPMEFHTLWTESPIVRLVRYLSVSLRSFPLPSTRPTSVASWNIRNSLDWS